MTDRIPAGSDGAGWSAAGGSPGPRDAGLRRVVRPGWVHTLVLLGVLAGAPGCDGEDAEDAGGERPDVLLVVIDTCRADHMGFAGARLGNGASPTPVLDRLAASGSPLRRGFTPVPLTLPAVTTILSGLLPDGHGVRENDSFVIPAGDARGYSLLAEDLAEGGYRTAALVSGQPLESRTGLDQGFQDYLEPSRKARQPAAQRFRERRAPATTDAAVELLGACGPDPLFLLVHYFDPHAPYERNMVLPGLPEGAAGRYLSEIALVDREVGRLLAAFEERGRPGLVIVVGDHGESLGEHGEATHGYLVHDTTLAVPFLVRLPASESREVDASCPPRLEDVYPTVLDVAGIRGGGPRSRDGRSLLQAPEKGWVQRGETLYPWYQFRYARLRFLRDRRYKVIEGGGRATLFDWREDPGETRDLAPELPGKTAELVSRLREAAKRVPAGRARSVPAPSLSGPYMASRPPDSPPEPTEEENRGLPRPEEEMAVIRALETARRLIRQGQPGRAFNLLRGHEERRDRNPALLFWTARALQLQGRDEGLGRTFRREQLEQAEELFALHSRRFSDPRAADSLLRVLLEQAALGTGRKPLEEVVRLVNAREAAGTATALAYVSRAQAHELMGAKAEALEDFRRALRLDPADPRIQRDVRRLEAAGR